MEDITGVIGFWPIDLTIEYEALDACEWPQSAQNGCGTSGMNLTKPTFIVLFVSDGNPDKV